MASLYHGTGRPVPENDNFPDPNSHIHNYVFNIAYDKSEGIWKAVKRVHFDLPDIQKKFHKRLAKNLNKIGYETRKTKDAFEVKGIADDVLGLYSGRQDEIRGVQKTREASGQKITEGYKARASQMVRQPKAAVPVMTTGELRQNWNSRLNPGQRSAVAGVTGKAKLSVKRGKLRAALKRHLARFRPAVVREPQGQERGNDRGR